MITLKQWGEAVKNNEKLYFIDDFEDGTVGVKLVGTDQHVRWDQTAFTYAMYCKNKCYINFKHIFTDEKVAAKAAAELLLKYFGGVK